MLRLLPLIVALIFFITYVGMAFGRLPGLRIDRTGIAVVAAIAAVAVGALSEQQALAAIDVETLIVLFAMMVISGQFGAAGVYEVCARRIVASRKSPTVLLATLVTTAGGLSTVLANDVVVFAMTPVLCSGLMGQGRDPRPFLIALAAASNGGSAATPIGNPQNILIGRAGDLEFLDFVEACAPPALIALIIVFATVRLVWHRHFVAPPSEPLNYPLNGRARLDGWQSSKAVFALTAVVAVFLTPVEKGLGSLCVVAVLLLSRQLASRDIMAAVDWHLLLLFVGLFVVTGAMTSTGLSTRTLQALDFLGDPTALPILGPVLLVLSNLVGNVPAVMLLLELFPGLGPDELHTVAVLSTLAGNFLLVGSFANLIVAERAALWGVRIGFVSFALSGVPIALFSMTCAILWFA